MATAAIVASAVIGVGTATASHFEQKKAARKSERAQTKANDIESASSQVSNARARRRAIAQARIAQAQNQANAGGQVQGSSMQAGVQSSISSQLGANIGAQSQSIGNQMGVLGARQQASNALASGQRKANMWNTVGSIGQSIGQGVALSQAASPSTQSNTANTWSSNTP